MGNKEQRFPHLRVSYAMNLVLAGVFLPTAERVPTLSAAIL